MTIIGLVEGEVVDKIELLSDRFMLFYQEGDSVNNIRAVNHTKYAEFFDLDKGTTVSITDLEEFEVVNSSRGIIFNWDSKVSDDDVVIRYAMLDGLLNNKFIKVPEISEMNFN